VNLYPKLNFSLLTQLIAVNLCLTTVTFADDLPGNATISAGNNAIIELATELESSDIHTGSLRDIESRWLDVSLPVELPWYRIELLLYLIDPTDPLTQEQWRTKIDETFPARLNSLNTEGDPQNYDAFTEIQQTRLEFNRHAKTLDDENNTRVVFHKAWHQPLRNRSLSTPLFIQAGNLYGNEYELEGTVTISVERYLHIDTDLRYSAFSEDRPLIQDWWLDSTAPPTLDQSNADDFSDYVSTSANFNDINSNAINANTINANALNTRNFESNAFNSPAGFTPSTDVLLTIDEPVQGYPASVLKAPIDDGNFMRTRQVQLKQTRRMKSKELHYIDHPLMGLLVKIVPFELPEQASTDSQADANSGGF